MLPSLVRRLVPRSALLCRQMSLRVPTGDSASYDGPGKTTVRIMNQETDLLMIDSFSVQGFRLNNGMFVYGPMAIFPTSVLGWAVGGPADVTPRSLALFDLLHPKPDVIVVGTGNEEERRSVDVRQVVAMRKAGLKVEVLTTENAIAMYNFLCEEGRVVGAALIPPDRIGRLGADDAKMRDWKNLHQYRIED